MPIKNANILFNQNRVFSTVSPESSFVEVGVMSFRPRKDVPLTHFNYDSNPVTFLTFLIRFIYIRFGIIYSALGARQKENYIPSRLTFQICTFDIVSAKGYALQNNLIVNVGERFYL